MKYNVLLMDADDTIFDFPECEYRALRSAMTENGFYFDDGICAEFSRINAALWRKFEVGNITRSELRVRRFREMLEACFSGMDHSEETAILLADAYVSCLAENAVFFDGAREALSVLKDIYDIYIITNGLKSVQEKRFVISGLGEYVKGIYISDALGVQKPDKAFFDIVLDDISEKDTSRILVVGDSLTSDMKGGRNAGLDTCLYDPKGRVTLPHELCDYRIEKLIELAELGKEE